MCGKAEIKAAIDGERTVLGIELGSAEIKAVLITENYEASRFRKLHLGKPLRKWRLDISSGRGMEGAPGGVCRTSGRCKESVWNGS